MSAEPATSPVPQLRELLRRDQLGEALRGLMDVFAALAADPALAGQPFPFPEFDRMCEEIGRNSAYELFGAAPPAIAVDHDLVLVTETYVQGGHAEIVRDLADGSERKLVIAVTNLHDRKAPILPELASHGRVAKVVVFKDPDLLSRLRGVQAMIANPAARRVLVLCHGNDSVAIAAAAATEAKPVLFFHHCDHTPCLGCFMQRAIHVDLHNLGFEHCRAQLGIAPAYICLTSRDVAPCGRDSRHAAPVFKSITCGAEHKLERLRYPITYQDVVVRLIEILGGVHFHVGPLSAAFVATIGDALEQAGLPRESFVHVGHVNGFREILTALEVDLYVPTLPQAGGKALVDAMSAGVPVLVHENAIGRLWGGRDLVYPSAPSWAGLDQLGPCLRRFGDDVYWREQATSSRAYYEQYHSNALFAEMLRADGMMKAAVPPALKPYRPGLRERLDIRAMAAP